MKLIIGSLLLILFSSGIWNSMISQKERATRSKTKKVELDDITTTIREGFGSKMQVVIFFFAA